MMWRLVLAVAALVGGASVDARPTKIERKTPALDYSYQWPEQAAAIPALNAWLQADSNKLFRQSLADAQKDMRAAKQDKFPFHQHEIQKSWESAGQSSRLLSLDGSIYGFTGGAHGNGGSLGLLWDRARNAKIEIPQLLLPGMSWTGAIRQPFCVLLDRERAKRREKPVKKDDMFGNCPEYKELTVIIVDKNGNGRFDHIQAIADAYVAGPYVEGPYEIDLPITAAMIARLKPEFRSSFEAQRPVQ